MKVRVIRAICVQAVRQEPGSVIDLPDHVAREAIHRGVVERVEPAPASAGPMTTESVAELVEGRPRRGAKNAVK